MADTARRVRRLVAQHGVQTIYPGHGPAGGLWLIEATREYLEAFASAVELGDADKAQAKIMARFPDHRVPQFLTVFQPARLLPPGR